MPMLIAENYYTITVAQQGAVTPIKIFCTDPPHDSLPHQSSRHRNQCQIYSRRILDMRNNGHAGVATLEDTWHNGNHRLVSIDGSRKVNIDHIGTASGYSFQNPGEL